MTLVLRSTQGIGTLQWRVASPDGEDVWPRETLKVGTGRRRESIEIDLPDSLSGDIVDIELRYRRPGGRWRPTLRLSVYTG